MCLNQTSKWNVMTIWISLDLPFFNFECLDISWASIVHPCQKLWPSELHQSFRVQFRPSQYIMRQNRTSEWKVMTIWISRDLQFIKFERLDILCTWIEHPSEMLWRFEFVENHHFSILSLPIYHGPQSYIHVKSYGRLNWTRASVLNFERLDILCAWIRHLSEMLGPFAFLENYNFSISSVSIYHLP